MRTHLGGPTHSFNALEKMLGSLVARATAERAASRAHGHGICSAHSSVPGAHAHFSPSRSSALPALPQHCSRQQQQHLPPPQKKEQQQKTNSTSVPDPAGPPTPALESAWMALEFLGALERGVHHACEGFHSRQPLSSAVLAFFATNQKVSSAKKVVIKQCCEVGVYTLSTAAVSISCSLASELPSAAHPYAQICEGWFTRVRHLTLRLSSLCGDHHAAIFHGWQRLIDLRSHLKPVLAQLNSTSMQISTTKELAPSATPSSLPPSVPASPPAPVHNDAKLPRHPKQQQQQQQKLQNQQQKQPVLQRRPPGTNPIPLTGSPCLSAAPAGSQAADPAAAQCVTGSGAGAAGLSNGGTTSENITTPQGDRAAGGGLPLGALLHGLMEALRITAGKRPAHSFFSREACLICDAIMARAR